MTSLKKFLTALAIGATLYTGNAAKAQTITVEGTVTSMPNNLPANQTTANFYKNSNIEPIHTTNTNNEGEYSATFVWDGRNDNTIQKQQPYPNPYNEQITIPLETKKNTDTQIKVYNTLGQIIYNEDIHLNQGQNNITLSGGEQGLYMVTIDDAKAKIIQTSQNKQGFDADVLHISENRTKSTLEDITLSVGDSLRIEYIKPNHEIKDTTFIVQNYQQINQAIQQIPTTFTTTLKPYLESGEAVTTLSPGFNITIQYPQPTGTKTYTPNSNNEIVINENLYPINSDLGDIILSHDTTNYTIGGVENGVLPGIILRYQNQPTNRPNIAQSNMPNLIAEPTLTVPIDSLNGIEANYYMLTKNAESQTGTWHRLDDEGIRGYMASSGDGLQTAKFIQIPPYSHVVLMKTVYDNDPTLQPSQANLDRAVNEYNKLANIMNLANNDQVSEPVQFFYTNTNDSIWNAVQSRTPAMDNCEVLTFRAGSPSVNREWIDTYTYNNESRIKYTKAKFSESATNGQIFTETYSATYGIEEGSGGLAPFVRNASTGDPTELGKAMARWVKLLDLGSGNANAQMGGKTYYAQPEEFLK